MTLAKYLALQYWALIIGALGVAAYAGFYTKKFWRQHWEIGRRSLVLYGVALVMVLGVVWIDVMFNGMPMGEALLAELELVLIGVIVNFLILSGTVIRTARSVPIIVATFIGMVCIGLTVTDMNSKAHVDAERTEELLWTEALVDLGGIQFEEARMRDLDLSGQYVYQVDRKIKFLYVYEGIAPTPGWVAVNEVKIIVDPTTRPRLEWYAEEFFYKETKFGETSLKEDKSKHREFGRLYLPSAEYPIIITTG